MYFDFAKSLPVYHRRRKIFLLILGGHYNFVFVHAQPCVQLIAHGKT